MFNIDKPIFNDDFFKIHICNKDNQPKKGYEEIFTYFNQINKQLKKYEKYAPNFEQIEPLSNQFTDLIKSGINEKLSNLYSPSLNICKNIKLKNIRNTKDKDDYQCPYCGIERLEVRDLDHFMPREKWPEFSILPTNLVYVCSLCNQRPQKGTNFLDEKTNKRLFLHPYYDLELSSQKLLTCNIFVKKIYLNIKFEVNPSIKRINPYIFEIASSHIKYLNLDIRYSRIAKRSLLSKFLNKFQKKDYAHSRIMKEFSVEEAQDFINDKIKELGTNIPINNYELEFWESFLNCNTFFQNISGKRI